MLAAAAALTPAKGDEGRPLLKRAGL